jgi:hypothetical protein
MRQPERKRPLERSRLRREDSIIMCLREVWWVGVDWSLLAQDRNQLWVFVNIIMNLQVP